VLRSGKWPHKGARFLDSGLETEAEGHAVRVVGVIVVVRTTVVDVTEVVSVVSIPKPPVVGRQIGILQNITNNSCLWKIFISFLI